MAGLVDVAVYFHICIQHGATFFSSVQRKNKKVYLWEWRAWIWTSSILFWASLLHSTGARYVVLCMCNGQKLLSSALTCCIWSTAYRWLVISVNKAKDPKQARTKPYTVLVWASHYYYCYLVTRHFYRLFWIWSSFCHL